MALEDKINEENKDKDITVPLIITGTAIVLGICGYLMYQYLRSNLQEIIQYMIPSGRY